MERTTELTKQFATRQRSATTRRVLAGTLVAAAAAFLAGLMTVQTLKRELSGSVDPLPTLGQLPAFTLTDQTAKPFGSSDLRGRVWVADFFFTACPGPCLAMNQRLKTLREETNANVRFVSITIDPQTDQPAVLGRYALRFGVEPPEATWHFLTGKQEAIYRLAREGFHLAAAGPAELDLTDRNAPSLAEFLHSTRFALVDGNDRVRGYYESTDDAEMQRLRSDMARLQKEPL